MNLSKIYSAQYDLNSSFIVEVEVDINKEGIGGVFKIVGLPDKAVDESKERVSSALKNSSFENPKKFKITASLSPANRKKEGSLFDLPIALGVLLANKELDFKNENKIFIGELSLNGDLKKIPGVLAMVRKAKKEGFKSIYLPKENADEASLVEGINIFPVKNLKEIKEHLEQEKKKDPDFKKIIKPYSNKIEIKNIKNEIDFNQIIGQEEVKRALTIAAAGGHNIAMYGPPGTGKSMLAKAFSGILPDLDKEKSLETTEIYSTAGILNEKIITRPPFRSPHHTSSYVAIIGGGTNPRPGEITLAHNGVLFLDEFTEFESRVIESMREPLEEKFINISRAKGNIKFPADFILVAAMNPPSEVYKSGFSFNDIKKFKKKLTGPIIDRIDLWIEVPKVDYNDLIRKKKSGKSSIEIKKIIEKSRKIQEKRFGSKKMNGNMNLKEIEKFIILNKEQENILKSAAEKMNFSPRVFNKIKKISRTIADLENSNEIKTEHILEALQYRPKEII